MYDGYILWTLRLRVKSIFIVVVAHMSYCLNSLIRGVIWGIV